MNFSWHLFFSLDAVPGSACDFAHGADELGTLVAASGDSGDGRLWKTKECSFATAPGGVATLPKVGIFGVGGVAPILHNSFGSIMCGHYLQMISFALMNSESF